MNYNYYTQDGHLMIEGETMWRICNSNGMLFKNIEDVHFHIHTGYNHFNPLLNPYAANHLHYFSKEEAERQLALRSE